MPLYFFLSFMCYVWLVVDDQVESCLDPCQGWQSVVSECKYEQIAAQPNRDVRTSQIPEPCYPS